MGAVSTSKKSSAGKNVLVFFIVFIILEMLVIFGIGKVFKNKDVTPSVMGYSLFMTKEDLVKADKDGTVVVPKNVLVIARDGLTEPKNKIGSAILCEDVDGVGTGVFWLDNLESKDEENGVDYIVTNGNQSHAIRSGNIVGVCASYFVTAGKVINFVTQKFGMICCAVVPLFLLVLIELIIAIANHSPEEYEEDEEEEENVKSVELDDFLFGGKGESEQIAKRRKKQSSSEDEEFEEEDELTVRKAASNAQAASESDVDFDFDVNKLKKPAAAERDFGEAIGFGSNTQKFKAAKADDISDDINVPAQNNEAPADNGSLRLKDDEYYEKASQLVEGSNATRPARRPAGGQRRRRRPVSSAANGVNSGASLEDLMKLMEEEQNKLKNQIK